jgi:hypothetical protein
VKILVAGEMKTGTTVTFFAIAKQFPEYITGFEPTLEYTDSIINSDNILVKSLVNTDPTKLSANTDFDYYSKFNKRIFIIRDPRDSIISLILYAGGFHKAKLNNRNIEKCQDLLKEKETYNSVSVLEIWKTLFNLKDEKQIIDILTSSSRSMERLTLKYDHLLIKYEDFIQGKTESLSKYLNCGSLDTNADVDIYSRVARSKSFNNWKNWFTAEDIEFFKAFLDPYINYFGYENSWETNKTPIIEPKHCSEYFSKLINERIKNER